jgi:hypothetical protein
MTGNIWRLLMFKFTEFTETVFFNNLKMAEFSNELPDGVKR